MGKHHYEMKTDRPQNMNEQQMLQLSNIHFAPYIQLATALIGKARHAGGNMFRHQMDTFAILLDTDILIRFCLRLQLFTIP